MLMSILTKDFNREILKADNGNAAIELCREHTDIDLILMDIQLPGMDGYEATRQIRQFNKDVVIIAQTAYGLSGEKENALKAGCDEYLSKPINVNELTDMILFHFGQKNGLTKNTELAL
jgi:CheY-like chemotaxis protein